LRARLIKYTTFDGASDVSRKSGLEVSVDVEVETDDVDVRVDKPRKRTNAYGRVQYL